MLKAWIIPFLAIGVGLGFSLRSAKASSRFELETIGQLDASAEPARTPARYRDFGHPGLSQIKMDLRTETVSDVLPLYAPGRAPASKITADRDQNGTHLGALYISSNGLTLDLF